MFDVIGQVVEHHRQIRRVPSTNLVQYHFVRLFSNILFVSPGGEGRIVCFHWKAGSVPSPSFRRWHVSEEKSLMSIRVCQPQQFSNRARYFVPSCHFSAKIPKSTTQRKDKNIIITAHQQVKLFSAYEGQRREQASLLPVSSSYHEQLFCSETSLPQKFGTYFRVSLKE